MRHRVFGTYRSILYLVPGPRARLEGFVLERVSAARVSFRGVSHAHRSITTNRSLTSSANLMPVSTLTQHQHGEPDSPLGARERLPPVTAYTCRRPLQPLDDRYDRYDRYTRLLTVWPAPDTGYGFTPVSYTHLTLPTICSV